jgi:hypothetical protein
MSKMPLAIEIVMGITVENISDSVSNMYWEHRMNTVKNEGKSEY